MPRTHFYSSYRAVRALEALTPKYGCESPSSVAEAGILLIHALDQKMDSMKGDKFDLLQSGAQPVDQLKAETPLFTVGEFLEVLKKMKEPLEAKNRYKPGINDYVTYPEQEAADTTPVPPATNPSTESPNSETAPNLAPNEA